MENSKIAVTGASGGLGTAVVDELASRGTDVAGLVRSDDDARALEARGAAAVRGDVRDPASLRALCRGAGTVIHLAAWMGSPDGYDLAREVNVDGTENVMRAAAAEGARRVVLASSIAVHGPIADGVVTEDAPLRKTGDPYGDTKLMAEERARTLAAELDLELVVLRPTMIYGPRSGSWTLTPLKSIRRGLPAVIGTGEDLLDAVYVDDAARAFVLAAETPEAAGETFLVTGETSDWNTFFGHYAGMYGASLRRVPAGLVKGGAKAAAAVTRALTGRARVVPEMIDVMTSRATYASEKARRVLGYEPEVGLEEGMRRTAAWLRESGELRNPATALVTGAASGLGSAVVRELLDRGLLVFATDIRTDGLRALADAGARVLELDVTDPDSVAAARDRIESSGEIVDVVVNVAGLARPGALVNQDLEEITLQIDVNAYGPLHLARAFAPAMLSRGWGRFVNISSTNGFVVTPFMGAYSASKHALEAISDALRLELAPFGVDVVVVQPGSMRTPFAEQAKASLRREIATKDSAWGIYLQRFLDSSLWGTDAATDPDVVARRVARLAQRGGRARVYGTLDAIPARAIAMMPDAIKDLFFRTAAGLRPLKRDPGPKAEGDDGKAAGRASGPAED